jgi:hypothetical protein
VAILCPMGVIPTDKVACDRFEAETPGSGTLGFAIEWMRGTMLDSTQPDSHTEAWPPGSLEHDPNPAKHLMFRVTRGSASDGPRRVTAVCIEAVDGAHIPPCLHVEIQ